MPTLPSYHTLSSPSWLYPFKVPRLLLLLSSILTVTQGIYYFSTHRFLWPLLHSRLLPCFLLSIFIYANLFIWTYLPQVFFLALFHWSGLAWFNGVILVLGEGAAIVALVFEAFFVDETQVDIFDAVLVKEGLEELVGSKRVVLPADEDGEGLGNPVRRLGKHTEKGATYAPFSLRQILEFVVFLPLNLIPWVGVPVFLVMTGYRGGPFHHYRYYSLLGVTRKEKKTLIRKRQLRYTWFGTVALMLQLIPGLSMVFLLTTAAGAALWVRDLERVPIIQVEQEEQYTDNPI